MSQSRTHALTQKTSTKSNRTCKGLRHGWRESFRLPLQGKALGKCLDKRIRSNSAAKPVLKAY